MEQKSEVEARNSSIFDVVVEKKPPSWQTEQVVLFLKEAGRWFLLDTQVHSSLA